MKKGLADALSRSPTLATKMCSDLKVRYPERNKGMARQRLIPIRQTPQSFETDFADLLPHFPLANKRAR